VYLGQPLDSTRLYVHGRTLPRLVPFARRPRWPAGRSAGGTRRRPDRRAQHPSAPGCFSSIGSLGRIDQPVIEFVGAGTFTAEEQLRRINHGGNVGFRALVDARGVDYARQNLMFALL
jgi:hypothetical protein